MNVSYPCTQDVVKRNDLRLPTLLNIIETNAMQNIRVSYMLGDSCVLDEQTGK
jgi:hypothetical protein